MSKDFKVINLKANRESTEQALAICEIEINKAKHENVGAIKFIHGYGSRGVGGSICKELPFLLFRLIKQHKIHDFVRGIDFKIENKITQIILANCEQASLDIDLNKGNPGITVVLI